MIICLISWQYKNSTNSTVSFSSTALIYTVASPTNYNRSLNSRRILMFLTEQTLHSKCVSPARLSLELTELVGEDFKVEARVYKSRVD